MPHRERHRWVEEVSKINQRINETAGDSDAPARSAREERAEPIRPPALRRPTIQNLPGGGFVYTNPDLPDVPGI